MRKISFLVCIVISILNMAQSTVAPDWYDADMRSMQYPRDSYFIGFVRSDLQHGESLEKAMERLKNAARAEAVSSIRTTIEHTINQKQQSQSVTTAQDYRETIYETFLSTTRLSSQMENIPELQVEAWYNEKDKVVAAFAWVKKSQARQYYKKQVQLHLGKVRSTLSVAEYLASSGDKSKALGELQKVENEIAQADEAMMWLSVFGHSEEGIKELMEERNELDLTLRQHLSSLSHATKIALLCQADMFGTSYSTWSESIKGNISELDCSYVSDKTQADWVITIQAKAREHNAAQIGDYTTYFVYVDATISIYKVATQQTIYENQLSQKGGHTRSNEDAARKAYSDLSPQLAQMIKEQIQ